MPSTDSMQTVCPKSSAGSVAENSTSNALYCGLIFLGSFVVLFLGSSRRVNVYDDGFILTESMRVLAGQFPHRDFYYAYGPAQLVLLAGLFRITGPSVLAARLVAFTFCSCVVVSVYYLASRYCRRSAAAICALICTIWFFGINNLAVSSIVPVSLLTLWSTWWLLQGTAASAHRFNARRLLAAGVLDGFILLFRYDVGLGIAAAHVAFLVLLLASTRGNRWGLFSGRTAAYLSGFAIVAIPLAVIMWSAGAISDLLYDIVAYPAKYYKGARGLPFPRIGKYSIDSIDIYLPILLLALIACLAVAYRRDLPRWSSAPPQPRTAPDWISFLAAFSLVAGVMFVKGTIRVSLVMSYVAMLPSLLMTAVLLGRQHSFSPFVRRVIGCMASLFCLAALFTATSRTVGLARGRVSMLGYLLSPQSQIPQPDLAPWCSSSTPLTRGLCYVDSLDNMRAIQYLRAHTGPADTLYSGVPHQDRIITDNVLIYFATGLTPATRWPQFEPNLQNRADIQAQIVSELNRNTPRYVVLDGEFDDNDEPNDSSKSTGVHLVDDYVRSHYQFVETFGAMSVLRRNDLPATASAPE